MQLIGLMILGACVEDVSKDKVEATVAEAQKVEAPAPAAGEEIPVVKGESSIKALGAKITATHPIVFHAFEGGVTVDGDRLTGVRFSVDMTSLEADDPRLTKHLMNEDFFDVPNHPTATFQSTSVEVDGGTAKVQGNLTIHGVTKSVGFPAEVTVAEGKVVAKTEFAIDRHDFGVSYPGKKDDLIQDKVVLTVDLSAHR
ncbi:MAG: YceI family protein [Alphaproteobacteria bacterium]|nr:YceI family protein [Alphaproteobacteria bacterium]MCB9692805.1 YceI family protein [Alphaproteobacteria bacterium]